MIDRPGAGTCACCAGPLDNVNTAVCTSCGRPFHLMLRNDLPGRDCGRVWVNDELQALEFGCNVCLGQPSAASSAPPATKRRYVRHDGPSTPPVARRRTRRRTAG